jgi:hypothetical protein
MKDAAINIGGATIQLAVVIGVATAIARGVYEYVPWVWGLFG